MMKEKAKRVIIVIFFLLLVLFGWAWFTTRKRVTGFAVIEWSDELLINPGAENGTNGWIKEGGGTLTAGPGCSSCNQEPKVHSGSNVFYFEKNTNLGTRAYQDVDLSNWFDAIIAGKARINATAWLQLALNSTSRSMILYRLQNLRAEGLIRGKFVGPGKGVWIWWKK